MSRYEDSGGTGRAQPQEPHEAGPSEPIESDASAADPAPAESTESGPAPETASPQADQNDTSAAAADNDASAEADQTDASATDDNNDPSAPGDNNELSAPAANGPEAEGIPAAVAAADSTAAEPAPADSRSGGLKRKSRPTAPGKRPRRPGRRWFGGRYSTSSVALGGLAGLLALVLVAGSLAVYVKYREVWDSITRVDVSPDLRSSSLPPPDPNALNLLLIGSDSRSGENGAIGGSAGISGARSDTDMIVHIAPGERRVVVISFPRDTVVPILNCAPEDGTTGQTAQPGQVEQLNATFAYGGPGCLWETLEQETGIHINDFIELTFVGFEQAINALGGVNVCLPETVHDPMSGLNLGAGYHHIWGGQALEFWRTREDLGEGDDLQRIVRDQYLMAALLQGIEHSGLLSSPSKMLNVVDALSSNRNITVDDQLTPTQMFRIAEDMHGISTESVQFVTSPYTTYEPNPNWVQWEQPQAEDLFAAVAHDNALPKSTSTGKKSKHHKKSKRGKKAASEPTPTVQPSSTPLAQASQVQASQVRVAVYNGTTASNLATTTSAALTARGFDVIGQPLDASSDTYTDSVIQYASSADLAKAQYLAEQVGPAGDVQLQLDAQVSAGTMNLIIGSTFSALQPVPSSSALENIASTYGGINGNVNICSDQSAFAGPDGA
jgi:LCP family protein required for cell wall assembly